MGKKGDKMTEKSVAALEYFIGQISDIQNLTTKRMFGGHGVFHDSKMFGMVNSKGEIFLKADGAVGSGN